MLVVLAVLLTLVALMVLVVCWRGCGVMLVVLVVVIFVYVRTPLRCTAAL